MNFIVNERLKWDTMEPRGEPFEFDGTTGCPIRLAATAV